jgi:hypothetical protein
LSPANTLAVWRVWDGEYGQALQSLLCLTPLIPPTDSPDSDSRKDTLSTELKHVASFLVWPVIRFVGAVVGGWSELEWLAPLGMADFSVTTGSMDASGLDSRFKTELRRELCSGKCFQQ